VITGFGQAHVACFAAIRAVIEAVQTKVDVFL